MNKLMGWIFGKTKIGKTIETVRNKLSGYKAYIVGVGIALPALLTMIQKFSDFGTSYLLEIPHSIEYKTFLEGLGIITLRVGMKKVGTEPTPSAAPPSEVVS